MGKPDTDKAVEMTLPTTAQAIYDLLEEDATIGIPAVEGQTPSTAGTLTPLLGTYRLKGASGTMPALAVLMPLEERPAGLITQGVEVVILRIPSGQTEEFMTGGETISGQFTLYATQWTPSTGGAYNVEAVARRIAQLLPGATWTTNTPPDGLGGLAQLAITWNNPEVATRWSDD